MADPTTFHFRLPRYTGAALPEPPHAWYPGIRGLHPLCTSDRRARGGDGRVRAFVIHATEGDSSAGAVTRMAEHAGSWHWLVPDENEPQHGNLVWACAPESRAAWHVQNSKSHPDVNNGSRLVNYWSLGVEIVNSQRNDPFSSWQVEQTAALVRYAWSKYPDLVDVVSHAKLDPLRRSDPGAGFPWEEFRELVLTAPTPAVMAAQPMPRSTAGPIQILAPSGIPIECDPRRLDGVTVAEARPLVEALGFRVEYDDGPPLTMRILGDGGARPARKKRAR